MDKILAYNPSLKTIATITTDVKRKDPLLARTGADDNVKDASLAIKKSPDCHRGLEGLYGHNTRSN